VNVEKPAVGTRKLGGHYRRVIGRLGTPTAPIVTADDRRAAKAKRKAQRAARRANRN
jgi:hypothetical protein